MTISVKDPARLVSDPGCPESQRELLQHGANIAPPRDAEARVWQGLVGVIGAAAIGGSADASTKTATAAATKAPVATLTTVKIVALVTALAAVAALGGYLLISAGGPRPPAAAPPAPIAEAPAIAPPPATAPTPPADETPPPGVGVAPRAAGADGPVRSQPRPAGAAPSAKALSPATRLREETTLIRDARQALRQGNATRALKVLAEHRRAFPAGVLEQERERLIIEALLKDGRAADASARAAAFLRKYPESPHASEVRGLGLAASGNR